MPSPFENWSGSVRFTGTIHHHDGGPVGPYPLSVPAQRVRHVRINDLIDPQAVPLGVPFGVVVRFDVPIVAQMVSVDTAPGPGRWASRRGSRWRAEVVRAALGRARSRLRRHGFSVLLAAGSGALAYLLAGAAFGLDRAYFAPIAAVVCVGLTAGQRIRRAAELALGVTLGLVAADLLVRVIGTGPWQMGVAVLVARGAAVALGAGSLMSNQASVAAILVVALSPSVGGHPWVRLGDALIGAVVALAVNAVAAPDPTRAPRRAVREVMDAYVEALGDMTAALATSDLAAAEAALAKAEEAVKRLGELDEVLAAATETARLARHRRRATAVLGPLAALRGRLDLLGVTTRSIGRAAANAVRHGQRVDERLVAAVGEVALALDELGRWAAGEGDAAEAATRAVEAAAAASQVLDGPVPTTIVVLVGHVRSAAVDVLRAAGHDQRSAVAALETVAGRADRR